MLRRSTYSLVLFAVAGAAFLAGGWHSRKEAVSAAAPRAETSRHVLYYSDGMHPQVKSERPGTCPICGMTLEPVYADAQVKSEGTAASNPTVDPGAGGIAVSAETQQLLGVRVGAAEAVSGADRLHLFGRVVPDETRLYSVNFGADGYTREIATITTGAQVTKDQWLATVSVPESRQPVQAYLVTIDVLDREMKSATRNEAQVELARASADLAADKLLTLGMSASQIEELRQTHRATSTFRITAPADGFVLARNVSLGQKLEKGQELFKLADLRRVWIVANVPANDASQIRPGMTADVTVPGRTTPWHARISDRVLPQFDPVTQSAAVRLELDNPGFILRPDMFVDVELQVPYHGVVSVPADAIVASGLRSTVFVERSAGVFEPRDVETGRRVGDRVTIVKGLAAGERVAFSGTFLLDSESRMKGHDRPHH
jgi:Cu(I)/Ag(I) efflux system membrane fusion protein